MSEHLVPLRATYSKPSTFDDGKPCMVRCEPDDPDATAVEYKIGGHYREYRFIKNTFTGHNDRGHYQREGEWPLEKAWFESMMQAAFEAGMGQQRKNTRDLFEKVMGIS